MQEGKRNMHGRWPMFHRELVKNQLTNPPVLVLKSHITLIVSTIISLPCTVKHLIRRAVLGSSINDSGTGSPCDRSKSGASLAGCRAAPRSRRRISNANAQVKSRGPFATETVRDVCGANGARLAQPLREEETEEPPD
ncbi:hypothetical protein EVAR_70518_1 [Eumeta japonica]|uniref:Uncharacterized protein n=1 Tax=Eumeta variegata TaxID=151549 RepID=A0A4C1SVX1_EUMVA|nr:hypothetical protein EVAR_70518_1 [Eumeta japonica]